MSDAISEDVKKLVVARLESMPENMKLSFGSGGDFDKYQLIKQVENDTDVGKRIVDMHLNYIRSFKRQ